MTQGMPRRGLLKAGGLGAATLLGGGAVVLGGAPAQAHGTMIEAGEINGYETYYQDLDNGNAWPSTFWFQPNLYAKLEEFAGVYFASTPFSFQAPMQIWLNGTHVDKPGMHQYGRAADISAIRMYSQVYGTNFSPLDGRWNVWKNDPNHMDEIRRWYWGGVCLLNKYFKYVLHYKYNSDHENHIHVDNEASNGTYSTFTTGSRSQVLTVQAACNYIFGLGTSIDGGWGPQTLNHSNQVLARAGWTGSITSSQGHWHRFLWACFRSGYNLPIN